MKNGTKRAPKGAPTSLNLWVLAQLMGDRTEVSNGVGAPDVPHLRRCLKAGLLEVDGRVLRLTPAGIEALRGGAR